MSEQPYGTWTSPITARSLVEGAVGIGEVHVDNSSGAPTVCWSESRPSEKGRVAVMALLDGTATEISPPEANVRTMVHEYGGGAWVVDQGALWFSDVRDHRLYRCALDGAGEATALTPEPEAPGALRYADIRLSSDGTWLVCVRERHPSASADNAHPAPANELVAIRADGSGEVRVLVTGPDFVSSPRLGAVDGGERLAWVQWNNPDLPWDSTALWSGSFDDGDLGETTCVFDDGRSSVVQPGWSADGSLLAVIDLGEWWNLYRVPLDGGAPDMVVGGDFEIGTPPWVFSMQRWAEVGGSPVTAATASAADTIRWGSGDEHARTDWSVVTQVRPLGDDAVVFIGARHDREPEVIRWRNGEEPDVLVAARDLGLDSSFFAEPTHVTFETSGGETAHALYYPPANPDHTAPDGELPPILVKAHGGPTAAARPQLQLSHRYWTSRGFGLVDVDYRGSIGYGRTYRHSLRGRWGVADVDDCIAAVEDLVDQGLADPARAAIAGGSAGGFTVLAALEAGDVFSAGASRYGVADLEVLATDTHKFEARYLDRLVGEWPADKATYVERSPIHHTDRLSCPMILLQGGEDKVVPPNQAELMIEALEAAGLPYSYVLFPDEGHGFRNADNIVVALESELSFFAQTFGFEPADDIDPITIANLA